MFSDEERRSMAVIHDDYGNQVVHISHRQTTFHVSLAGDQESAVCIETGQRVEGRNRGDCLQKMAALIDQRPCSGLGVCG